MKRALVLAGGGAKGSYEIGVYKALKKLGIKIDIITGTSIGSLNGALLASDDYKKAKKLWLTMTSKEVFGYDFTTRKSYIEFTKDVIKNKGLKFDKAEEVMGKYIDEEKIRKSKIDYGLVTYNLKSKMPKSLSKDSIPSGKMLSYIMASASCFPFVEMKKVDDDYYIDGGYYDVLPINLAAEMGAEEVIAVDLSAIGIKQKIKNKNLKIDYIKTNKITNFVLDFNIESAKKNIQIGYNDTMKHYKKLDGKDYTFKKGNLLKNYNEVHDDYVALLKKVLLKKSKIIDILKNKRYKSMLGENDNIKNEIDSSIEYLAEMFKMDIEKVYNIKKFNKKLIKEAEELNYISIDKNLKGKMLIGYIYNKYMKASNKEESLKKLYNLALLFPKDFLAAIYLITISNKYRKNSLLQILKISKNVK